MKPMFLLQTQVAGCWALIASGADQRALEEIAQMLNELSMFCIIKQSCFETGEITEVIVRRWMPGEQQ